MARYDDLNTGAIAYATVVSSILLLIVILLTRALCFAWVEKEDARKLNDAHYVQSDSIIAAQKARVSASERVTVEIPAPAAAPGQPQAEPTSEERIHIPVQRAGELLIKELSGATKSGEEA
ncbi:MAG: hypothetical protein KDB22_25890 [Planctomycetales bacterium]|nr:hypothetical protein [Planctomycetales bacterium]